MELTVKNLTMFILGKERRWLPQNRFAGTVSKAESQISSGKRNFTVDLSEHIARFGYEIAAEVVSAVGIDRRTSPSKSKERLQGMLGELAGSFDLSAGQQQRIADFSACAPEAAIDGFVDILGSFISSASTSVADGAVQQAPQPGALARGMLLEALGRQLDAYVKHDIYLKLHRRTETISIAEDRRSLTRAVDLSETYCNPNGEPFRYTNRRVFSWRQEEGETREQLRARKLRDQIFAVNGEQKTPENLKLEEREHAFLHPAQWELSFDYPVDPAWKEFTIRHQYTSTEPLSFDRNLFTFKLAYPCLHLHHTIALAGGCEKDWQLFVTPFEPFLALKIPEKKSPVTGLTDLKRNQATIEMEGPVLPGAGYIRRISYKKESTADDYQPAFFDEAPEQA